MSESDINFKTLKKADPYIERIVVSCSNTALYNFNTKRAEWERTEVEGTLFLFQREAEPKYGFTIMNRLNPENHIEPVTRQLDFQINPPFILYKNSENEIRGLWFFSSEECQKIGNRIQELVKEVEREQEAKKGRNTGGGGNLSALFEKADKARQQQKAQQQQQQQKRSSPLPLATTSTSDSGKNLLRLLSQPENNNNITKQPPAPSVSTKGETTESVNAFFAMASNNQIRVTPQPVLNGGMPLDGVNCSSVEGAAANILPAQLGLNQQVFGMPAGVIQALPISQGLAMGAVPVGGFAPYPGNAGGFVGSPANMLPPPAMAPHPGQQGGQMAGLGKPVGAMTVEKLEEEQRKSLSPTSRMTGGEDGSLGDLSTKLKEQLGVKMASAAQASPPKLPHPIPGHLIGEMGGGGPGSAGGGPVLMSPHVFASSSPIETHPKESVTPSTNGRQMIDKFDFATTNSIQSNSKGASPAKKHAVELSPLTRDQLVEAMDFLLKNDDSFVEKLHLAYVQSLQQKLK